MWIKWSNFCTQKVANKTTNTARFPHLTEHTFIVFQIATRHGPLAKIFQNVIVDRFAARDFTVNESYFEFELNYLTDERIPLVIYMYVCLQS